MHILVVDDDLDMLTLFVKLLSEAAGYPPAELSFTHSPVQAMEYLRLAGPGFFDVVISDTTMPEMHGFDLLRFIRGRGSTERVLIKSCCHEDEAPARTLGADDFVLCPFKVREFRRRVLGMPL